MYNECIQLTRQFAFCPNAFRVDLYKGCNFGCKYCFANMDGFKITDTDDKIADISKIQKLFHKALETDKESKDILVELIRHQVPIHCGGMSDPFQSREWEYHLTKKLIELSNKYKYPIQFSTKTSWLPHEYWNLLNPDIHTFQLSMIGWSDEYVKKWECNTSSMKLRKLFLQVLRQEGFFASVRIQPIIDIDEVLLLIQNLENIPSYITVEHFKLIYDTKTSKDAFMNLVSNKKDYVVDNHKLQVRRDVKVRNIKKIQELANSYGVEIGVGDNDLHYMTQGRTCCGIDRIPSFGNYLRYNLTYMSTGELEKDVFIPKCNARKHINDQKYGNIIDCKKYTDDYISNHLDYLGKDREEEIRKLLGVNKKRLF